ncbi:MAG TPA: exodeoxyribonuclease VII large subunit, partial [Longimicrobiales bacterium]|nr:exodeoxyribonuclease VII large subunit [Longimicrobiales bacterium]
VSELTARIKECLEGAFRHLRVEGEVSNHRLYPSGHRYFSLKDDGAQIRVVLFRGRERFVFGELRDGQLVVVTGALGVYEKKGEYQIYAQSVEVRGIGSLLVELEQRKARLAAEGLFDAARKRPLPRFPSRIGVVTSRQGAALRDMIRIARKRWPAVGITLAPCLVQGEGAAEDIARALDVLGSRGGVDLIIVGRGGGSVEDLWAFNEEPLARAIVACATPVVSAVGHEVDVTISDLVADLRAPTPSAAAEAVVPDGADVAHRLQALPPRLARGLQGTLARRRSLVGEGLARLHRVLERRLAPPRQAVDLAMGRLERGLTRTLERKRVGLSALAGRLQALSPLAILERGYSVARTPEGRLLRRVEDFTPGLGFHLRVVDGTVRAEAVEHHQEEKA